MSKLQAIKNIAVGKTYELSLVKTYVAHWGMAQAVRELIQNSLDSDSPFVYEFSPDGDRQMLVLTSEFSSLTPQSLLLGATSKATDEASIGSFGEGYKIALLVLTREGYDVTILNGQLVWTPRFKMSRSFEQEVLAIDESYSSTKHTGLSFIVRGLTDSDVESIRKSCLRMQDHIGGIKRTAYGDILLDKPGELYVGSLFICTTEMKFGYNVLPQYIQLERDRETVSSWDLKNITLKMWYDTKEYERIANMIKEEIPDIEYSNYDSPELVKAACYQIFKEEHPGAIIAESPADMKKKIAAGMTKTVYIGGGMYHAVSRYSGYQRESRQTYAAQRSPHVRMLEFLSKHRSQMKGSSIDAFEALMKEAQRNWTLK